MQAIRHALFIIRSALENELRLPRSRSCDVTPPPSHPPSVRKHVVLTPLPSHPPSVRKHVVLTPPPSHPPYLRKHGLLQPGFPKVVNHRLPSPAYFNLSIAKSLNTS